MKKKKFAAALIATLAVTQSMTAFAAPANNSPTGDQHTTIGIMEAEKDISQVSFEVPLYVTTAAISGSTKLLCPDGYDIKNTSTTDPIGVVSLTVERVGDWNTVDSAPTTGNKQDVMLTIGDLTLPSVNENTSQNTVVFLDAKKSCAFYGKTTGKTDKLTSIPAGQTLSQAAGGPAVTEAAYKGLGISGTVSNDTRTNKKAAAQFRVTYVISMLDANGDPLGNTYVGDNKAASGMQ